MKVLVVGLGSMGKRRIRNLKALGYTNVIGFDPRDDRRQQASEQYGIRTVQSFEDALEEKPGAMIVSTPPNVHMQYAHRAADLGIPFFIEASVVDEGMDELMEKLKAKPVVAAPSCTLRFHPAIKIIKEWVDAGVVGKISSFTYHSGQYLPDWHPWEDIQDFYVSQKETGGCREIVPFELTWLQWVFGGVNGIAGAYGSTIDLGVPIDDVYQAIFKFETGVLGHLMVDVVSRPAMREMTILGDQGSIQWNWNDPYLRRFVASKGEWEEIEISLGTAAEGYNKNIIEEMYIEEMQNFFNAIQGKGRFINTLEEDREVLNILYQLEKNSL